jgi:Ca2+-binding EF-hand superfamily protein
VNTRIMTAALVALTMVVMAMTPLMNNTENLDEIGTVGYDHGGGVANETAILGGTLTWQDGAWDASWSCNGGLALVTPADWSNFLASSDNDPHNYTSWGIELTGAGSYYTAEAPAGEWVVTAGLGCIDDMGDPRSAGGQYGDVHENPPTVNLTNDTTVGDVSFTLIEYDGGDEDGAAWLLEMLDADGDGNLSLVELIDGINELNNESGDPPLSDEEEAMFSNMFNESDFNGDGLLDYDELGYFVDLMDSEDDGPTFVCGNGEEIPFYYVNDGDEDCEDGADEQQFNAATGEKINWFDCHDGSEVWIDQVNDGTEDCPDGEDEGNDYDDGPPSAEELMYMFDADGDGNLSFDELVNGANAHNNESGEPPMSEEEEGHLENGFNMADADGNGLLDIDELDDLIDMMNDEDGGDDFTYGDATLNATTIVMSPDYDPTMMVCEGGVGLATAADFAEWTMLQDDPSNYLTWGVEHSTAGNIVDDSAPEGEYVVFAGLECMDTSGVHWEFAGYDMSADGTPTMHTFTNDTTTTVEIYLFNMDDGGGGDGGDGPACDSRMVISFQQNADNTADLTFANTCTYDANGSADMMSYLDTDGDGILSADEINAAQDAMANQTCHAEDGTEVPCNDVDNETGLFSFDGTVLEPQPMMGDGGQSITANAVGRISMSSIEVVNVPSNVSLYSHTFEYDAGADWDGGHEECSGGIEITAASPWSVSNVSFSPESDWVSGMHADGSGWSVDNIDSDGDGDCKSEPSSVVIVFTAPEPEPVVDTTPTCDIFYHLGDAVLAAGSTWSVQLDGAVSFEVPSDGEFTLALPVGEYSVVLACNDAESDAIDVSVTDGNETWGGTAQNGVIYAEGFFRITEDNVTESVDITLTWSSTDFGGTFNLHFTAVESIADAIEDSDIGGLPGFTASLGIMAMLGAAMILARRKV